MKKILLGIMWGLCLLSVPALAQEAKKPIKIGYINAYTGGVHFVVPNENGIKLALEEINAKGGVLGRPLEIISRDSKLDPAEAVRLAEELLARDKVDILMNCDVSNASVAVGEWAGKRHIPFVIGCSEADSILWNQKNPYMVRTNPGGYAWNAGVIQKAKEIYGDKLKNKRWVSLAQSFEFGRSLVKTAKEIVKEQGLNASWVGEQWPVYNKLSAGSTIAALERSKPDVVYATLFGTDVAKFIREAKKRNFIKDRIFIFPVIAYTENMELLGKEMPKDWVTVGFSYDEIRKTKPSLDAFMKRYQKVYPNELVLPYAIYGYSGVKLIAAAIEKAGSMNTEKIAAAFDDLRFDTPFGEQTIRKIDHQATTSYWVGVTDVIDGRPKFVNWTELNVSDNSPPDAFILKIRDKK